MNISWPGFEFSRQLAQWHELSALHYMDMADGFPWVGQFITFGDLKDGVIRGTKFDKENERQLGNILKGKGKEEITRLFLKFNGESVKAKGDICFKLPFFPSFPVYCNIWFADEEFPAAGKMFLDKSADHYLTIEDAIAVGTVILDELQPRTAPNA